jgi:flagellar biosynthesis protein FlhA
MLNQLHQKMPAAVEGLVPELLSLSDVQSVLRNLLRERVPIRDLGGILEILANNAPATRDPAILAEAVRQSMALTLSNQYRDGDGFLHVFTLSPQIESILRASLGPTDSGLGFQIDASLAQMILTRTGEQMEKLAGMGFYPVLLCPRELRMAFHRLVERSFPNLTVLAFSEVSTGTKVKAHGLVEVE